MEEKFYAVDFKSLQLAYAIKINDILIETNQNHNLPRGTIKANQWMYNGKNTFEINLSVNPKWENDLDENYFILKIIEHVGTDGNYSPYEIVFKEWKYQQNTKFPVVISGDFSIDIPFGNWTWRNADILNEDTMNIDSLRAYMSSLRHFLNTKNFNALEPLLQIKSTELAQAYYLNVDERFSDQKEFFTQELFGNPIWEMQEIDFDTLLFRRHAENRLVEVLNIEGKSPIRSISLDGYTFSLPLFLCHKNDQWILCR
jgi:hypothetical protein